MTASPNGSESDRQRGPLLTEGPYREPDTESCPEWFVDSTVLLGREVETRPPPSPRLTPQRVTELAERVFGQETAPARTLPVIPGFEVLEVLGRGGMGIVYQARHIKLNRLVALKMLAGGFTGDPSGLARFRTEVEAVARLQHPNIVQIFEVGEYAGQPYCVLEFVGGGSLARKLAGTPQPVREAAACAEILARAAHHAHQRGILHRDLKPSNVLLSADGMPRIADFGLAKCFEAETSAGADPTRSNLLLGTPGYMAPEQAEGRHQDMSPATDVYALGAILYELVIGRAPFRGETVIETLWQTRFQEPLPLSRMRARVPRDLETICLKCLEKGPPKRYATAEALADDLRRFLAGEPIQARRASLGERLAKWARRRPTAAALLSVSVFAVFALLAAGWTVAARERQHGAALQRERDEALRSKAEAERHFQTARQAADKLTELATRELAQTPGMEKVNRQLLVQALKIHQEFLKEASTNLVIRHETARAHLRVGAIQERLGQDQAAKSAYEAAVDLLENLRQESADSPNYRHELSRALCNLAYLQFNLLELEAAESNVRRALDLSGRLSTDFPQAPQYRADSASAYMRLGMIQRSKGRIQDAEQAYRHARELQQVLVKEKGNAPGNQEVLATINFNLGQLVRVNLRQLQEAETLYREAIALMEPLVERYPGVPLYRNRLGRPLLELGRMLMRADKDEAAKTLDRSSALFEKLVADFPETLVYGQNLAASLGAQAQLLRQTNLPDQALALYRQTVQILTQIADANRRRPMLQSELGRVLQLHADLHREQKQWADARPLLEEAIRRQQLALELKPGAGTYERLLRVHYRDLADTVLRLGDHAEGARAAGELARLAPVQEWRDHKRAADILQRCRQRAEEDTALAPAVRQNNSQVYGAQAERFHQEAVKRGYKPE